MIKRYFSAFTLFIVLALSASAQLTMHAATAVSSTHHSHRFDSHIKQSKPAHHKLKCSHFPTPLAPAELSIDIEFGGLVRDLRLYKTTNVKHHSGDLYEHLVWVTHTIEQWFADNEFWVEGVNVGLLRTLMIASFLHDIGKGGDRVFKYGTKLNHPQVTFDYLRGAKKYIMANGSPFDIDRWFKHNQVNHEERAMIATLGGAHWDFGGIMLIKVQNGSLTRDQACAAFLNKLKGLIKLTGYNNGHLDQKILRAAILIGAADVRGANYAACPFPHTCSLPDVKAPHKGINMYEKLQYQKLGRDARNALLKYAETHGYYEN